MEMKNNELKQSADGSFLVCFCEALVFSHVQTLLFIFKLIVINFLYLCFTYKHRKSACFCENLVEQALKT